MEKMANQIGLLNLAATDDPGHLVDEPPISTTRRSPPPPVYHPPLPSPPSVVVPNSSSTSSTTTANDDLDGAASSLRRSCGELRCREWRCHPLRLLFFPLLRHSVSDPSGDLSLLFFLYAGVDLNLLYFIFFTNDRLAE